ncbi:MAG TPA: class I SAM-dependent methyltransferase, partial [Nitrososphaera sp.]
EHLFHEAMHQKLYDFRHGHLLMNLDCAREDAPRVRVPWNAQKLNNANLWEIERVLAAFHVYVHLSLLALVAEQRASDLEDIYGRFEGMMKSVTALERAHYLGEKLKEQFWDELGPAGKSLADWLISALEFLDPNPPPKDAYIHLYLDLYKKETNQIASALSENHVVQSSLAPRLIPLAKQEVEDTRRVLSVIGARDELDRFNNAVLRYTEEELGAKFPELRGDIATRLINASYDRYRLNESGGHDELVKQMMENASRRVYPILAGYPPVVADAKRRGNELRFSQSCEDQVGRLLSVLACAVPSGGRILEIGTGAGVGTAWITAGLGERTDCEVVSVEINPQLSEATRKWPWPSYVQILTTNGLDALGKLGTFNLVFADAGPIKYNYMASVLKILRPGGLLVIDCVRTSEVQNAEKDALRRSLLYHPELNAVEMEWSTGVILATKSKHPS